MKTLKQVALYSFIAIFSATQMGCFGKFSLTRKLYSWNNSMNGKFLKSAVFWVFCIIPVYEVVGFIDVIILNVIEFWSGSNPVAMKAGEKETQMVAWRGNQYQITATQNRFHIEQMTGKHAGKVTDLLYRPEDKSWNAVTDCQDIKLVSFSETKDHKELVTYYKPDGSTLTVSANESLTVVQEKLSDTFARK